MLIGCTTENPAYTLTRAIVSRVSVFEVKRIEVEDIKKTLRRAIDSSTGLKAFNIKIDDEALTYFATAYAGDVRSALNDLEVGALTTNANSNGETVITKEIAVECLRKKALEVATRQQHYIMLTA